MKKVIPFTFLFAFLTGCVSTANGPLFQKHDVLANNKAVAYFYRPSPNDGVTTCWKIKINDISKGCLNPSGFIKVELTPGDYNIQAKAGSVDFKFLESIQGGQAYYYEIDFYPPNAELSDAKDQLSVHFIFNGTHAILPIDELKALPKLVMLKES